MFSANRGCWSVGPRSGVVSPVLLLFFTTITHAHADYSVEEGTSSLPMSADTHSKEPISAASSSVEEPVLPFADAPSVVRAHQKDSYLESIMRGKLQDTLQIVTSQRFIHTHPEEITVVAKALYLGLTTLLGSRTLGEEYTDLIYVTRNGRQIPKLKRRLGFVLAYAVLPYYVTKLAKKLANSDALEETNADTTKKGWKGFVNSLSYSKVLDTLLSAHLALFYMNGAFYNLSKRVFGMRYAFGHKVDKNEQVSRGGYELLGGLIFAQIIFKVIGKIRECVASDDDDKNKVEVSRTGEIRGVPNPSISDDVDLTNPKLMKFIPENSRKCMLCLSYMVNPSCAPCGHMFCWSCIADWSREHPECPLCRQSLTEQTILPLH